MNHDDPTSHSFQLHDADPGLHDDTAHALGDGGLPPSDLPVLHVHDGLVGTPDWDVLFNHPQKEAFTCAVQAQAGIIQEFTGENLTEGHAAVEAAEHGWLTTSGMDPDYVGESLKLHGIECHTVDNANVRDIMQELALGHKVIVGVKAEELWDPANPMNAFTSHSANHAIWVTGVDFRDPDHPQIIINDSGKPEGAGNAYDLNEFTHAWQQSGYHYVATDQAPPHLEDRVPEFDHERGAFPDLVEYLQDHIPEFAVVGASAIGGGLLIRRKLNSAKSAIEPRVSKQPDDTPALPAPRSPLAPPPYSVSSMSEEERDRVLRDL